MPKICRIPVGKEDCEDKRRKCSECPYKDNCDYFWIGELWEAENKKNGRDSLLGPFNPAFAKPEFRKELGMYISITGKYDFCRFNVSKKKNLIVVYDIYIDEKARGQGIGRKLLEYLMQTYDLDLQAKCVRGTSAESFWQHMGTQIDANDGRGPDMYEHREGKRDLGWYRVENKNKKIIKENLW